MLLEQLASQLSWLSPAGVLVLLRMCYMKKSWLRAKLHETDGGLNVASGFVCRVSHRGGPKHLFGERKNENAKTPISKAGIFFQPF